MGVKLKQRELLQSFIKFLDRRHIQLFYTWGDEDENGNLTYEEEDPEIRIDEFLKET